MKVELKYASVPSWRLIAVHYWFVVTDENERRERWEVWQDKDCGGISNGYIHRNLWHPDCNVGAGPTRLAYTWTGEEAQRIISALQESWDKYPHRLHYRAFPGPNSNTYVAWVIKRARIRHRLSWRGIGKDY